MRCVLRFLLGALVASGFISRLSQALPATEYSLGQSAGVSSLAGRSDSDVFLMRGGAIFHFDGKRAVKTKNQPVCVATYPEGQGTYPQNVDARDAEIAARRFRARPANAEEDYRWQAVEFSTLVNEGGVIRLYGSGSQMDARGSVRRLFTAGLRGGAWFCEGWFGAFGASILDLANDGESTFAAAQGYANELYQDPETYPFAALSRRIIGVTAAGIHGVWAWDSEGPNAYHLDGFRWDVRPLATWSSVVRVQSAGPGLAFAIGSTTERRDEDKLDIQADAFASWDGRAWTLLPLPSGFTAQPRGLLVESNQRVLLVGDNGQYYWYENGAWKADSGPQIQISAAWRSPSEHWFLAGKCGERDCLVKIGGQS